MGHMEAVINQLSEIEESALWLENMAAKQKEELSAEYEQKTLEFDKQIDAGTEEKLKQLTKDLNCKAEKELREMQQEMERDMAAMEQEYRENHKEMVSSLIKSMTGG